MTEILSNVFVLGQYKTKERALEVLDEIQKHLIDINTIRISQDAKYFQGNIDGYTFESYKNCVYQMPKE